MDFCPHCGGTITGQRAHWTPVAMINAAREWAEWNDGEAPVASEWANAAPEHPAANQVISSFGSWGAFIAAAGYVPKGRGPVIWTRERIIDAMLDWVVSHGRWPTSREWLTPATANRPHMNTVIRLFGTWDAARREAGYTGSPRAKLKSLRHARRPLVRAA